MNLLKLIVLAGIALTTLASIDASATCTAGGGAGSGYEISVCGVVPSNTSRFCQTSSVNEKGELYSEHAELICCDKGGNAVSISGDQVEAVSA